MITANTPPRKRTRRRGRKRELFLGQAILLAVLATLGVSILLALALVLIPHTALRDLRDLYVGQVPISPQSQVMQDIQQREQNEQSYFVAPIAFLIGGLVFGLTAPHRLSRGKTVLIGALIALVFNLLLVGIFAAFAYHNLMHSSNLVPQMIAILIWSVCSMIGTFLGTRKRGSLEAPETT